jgi:MraZ protein
MEFGGISEHTLDSTGRVIIPERLRLSLGTEFIITKGLTKRLCIYTTQMFRNIEDRFESLGDPLTAESDPKIMMLLYQKIGERVKISADRQGRVGIPARLRDYAEITNSAVLIAVGNWIEVWNPDNWKAFSERALTEENLLDAGEKVFPRKAGGEKAEGDAGVSQTGPAA